jgi:flavin reductase (DIM6/NTAB) family NADH-FMN oxidoreductase RutF
VDPQMAETFRSIPYGVYLLTARQGADLFSVVVSWVSQVSFSPPRLMVALRHNRKIIPAIREDRFFSLSLLSREQKALVAGLKDPHHLQGGRGDLWEEGNSDRAPILKDCLAAWKCRLVSTVEAGDHFLFLGEVESVSGGKEGWPLTTLDLGKTYIGQF